MELFGTNKRKTHRGTLNYTLIAKCAPKIIEGLPILQVYHCSQMAAQVSLPSSTSLSLALVQPLAAEKLATWHLNGQVWRGPLSLETYKRKEEFLSNQEFTRNGGMTFWILVDASVSPSSARRVLSSCETLKKRALVVRRDGKVDEVVSHGIMSVFCDPELRGRGYAGRMMEEFGKVLHTWQQEDNRKADFTVLFSDIGKVGKPASQQAHELWFSF